MTTSALYTVHITSHAASQPGICFKQRLSGLFLNLCSIFFSKVTVSGLNGTRLVGTRHCTQKDLETHSQNQITQRVQKFPRVAALFFGHFLTTHDNFQESVVPKLSSANSLSYPWDSWPSGAKSKNPSNISLGYRE